MTSCSSSGVLRRLNSRKYIYPVYNSPISLTPTCRYTRSSIARKNKKAEILDTKQDISYEHTKIVRASDEGTYEVVAIKDKYCSFSVQDLGKDSGRRR